VSIAIKKLEKRVLKNPLLKKRCFDCHFRKLRHTDSICKRRVQGK